MLISMSACANDYLNNTSYGHCQVYLRVRVQESDRLFPYSLRFHLTLVLVISRL